MEISTLGFLVNDWISIGHQTLSQRGEGAQAEPHLHHTEIRNCDCAPKEGQRPSMHDPRPLRLTKILLQVIKALYDYEPENKNGQELAFHKGDFFHVISREDDPDWYEACNPLIPTARGLVPVSFFEVIGKNERRSAGSVGEIAEGKLEGHDSGFSDRSGHGRSESTNTTKAGANIRMSSIGKGSGAMVYGLVMYDFNAERPDELEAKAGEAIIVIAQSNPEWFVAKPIGRLGGPGLIPVSFIEIRDMTTGQAVPDPHEAVRRAGVPKVEEWKKMAADYKNSSITLGKFDTSSSQQSLPQDMARMSVSNQGGQYSNQNQNGSAYVRLSFLHFMERALISSRAKVFTTEQPAKLRPNRMLTIRNRNNSYLLRYLPQFLVTALTTTNIGTLLSVPWRTAGTGNYRGSTQTFTIFRLLCSKNSQKKQATHLASPGLYLSCRVPSRM